PVTLALLDTRKSQVGSESNIHSMEASEGCAARKYQVPPPHPYTGHQYEQRLRQRQSASIKQSTPDAEARALPVTKTSGLRPAARSACPCSVAPSSRRISDGSCRNRDRSNGWLDAEPS